MSGKVIQISAGGLYSLALLDNGEVKGWGNNIQNQTTIPNFGGIKVKQIYAADATSFALLDDGTICGWGLDGIFNGLITDIPNFLDKGKRVTQIAPGAAHVLTILDDGTIDGWGDDSDGQISRKPDFVALGRKVIQITCGAFHCVDLNKPFVWRLLFDLTRKHS